MKIATLATAMLACAVTLSADAYQNFPFTGPDGQPRYLKWGDNHAGTPSPVIHWSFIPAGTPGSATYCGEACPGLSVDKINVFDPATNTFKPTLLTTLAPQITAALQEWAGSARVVFAGPDMDSGAAINAAGADAPATGNIRVGAFGFVGNAQYLGAVGYAAPPNGGTGSGDLLFNATNFFQLTTGAEGTAYDLYPPGGGPYMNDLQGIVLHELGHTLGMAHPFPDGPPDGPCAVMSINPDCYEKVNHLLDPDDVAGIRFLYGASSGAAPVLTINSPSIVESNTGTHNLVFTVNVWPKPVAAVKVKFATSDGTAVAGADYVAKTGTLGFTAGQTSKTISVPLVSETTPEADETFNMTLSAPTGATIGNTVGVGTIVNDDGPQILIKSRTVPEGNSGSKVVAFGVTLGAASSVPVSVHYATADETATAGSDYVATSGDLVFAPGQVSRNVNVSVLGDKTVEPTETFRIDFSAPVNTRLPKRSTIGTITNDD